MVAVHPRPAGMRSIALASVAVAMLLAACSSGSRSLDQDAAGSCVAPFLRSDDVRRPPPPHNPTSLGTVTPGQQVTVFGRWYYAGPCHDVLTVGQKPRAARAGGAVQLALTTNDRTTRNVAMGKPSGPEAFFAATFVVPLDAHPGPARISDGQGHVVLLTITPH